MDGEIRRRCVLSRPTLEASQLEVQDDEIINYLSRSLRLRPGQSLECLDGMGQARLAELTEFSSRQISGQWLEPMRTMARPSGDYPLPVLALLKGKDNDEAIRVHSELGLPKVRLFRSDRDARGQAQLPLDRWQRLAQEACRQSGGYHVLQVEVKADLATALSDLNDHQIYYGDSGAGEPEPSRKPKAILVGPEGGFSAAEFDRIRHAGGQSIGLGWGTMRARSAGVALPAVFCLGAP